MRTRQLQAMVNHSDESYNCEEMSAGGCDFDLCSDCAMKNSEMERKNECSKGHQLYPISVNADGWRSGGWYCSGEECGYEWSPDQELDQDIEVWRCEHDQRKMSACSYTGTTIINKIPWGDWPAGETQEEDQAEESDTNREEVREEERRECYHLRNCCNIL